MNVAGATQSVHTRRSVRVRVYWWAMRCTDGNTSGTLLGRAAHDTLVNGVVSRSHLFVCMCECVSVFGEIAQNERDSQC